MDVIHQQLHNAEGVECVDVEGFAYIVWLMRFFIVTISGSTRFGVVIQLVSGTRGFHPRLIT